jgi:hypothetical protein
VYYKFTATDSIRYVFQSISADDSYARLYDINGTLLKYNDDYDSDDDEYDFYIGYTLEAGQTYILGVGSYDVDTFYIQIS